MDWKHIREELLRLSEVVDGWSDRQDVGALERDWALEKLRSLYESIRFADSVSHAKSASAATEPDAVSDEAAFAEPVDLDLSGMLALESESEFEANGSEDSILSEIPVVSVAAQSDGPIPLAQELKSEPKKATSHASRYKSSGSETVALRVSQPKIETLQRPSQSRQTVERLSAPPQPRPVLEPELVPEPEIESESLREVEILSEPKDEPVTEVVEKFSPNSESKEVPIAEPHFESEFAALAPEPEPEPEPEPFVDKSDAAPVAATLFDAEEEDALTRHRRKQRVIMSLYGEDKPTEQAGQIQPRIPTQSKLRSSGGITLPEKAVVPNSNPEPERAEAAVPDRNRRNSSETFEEVTVETIVSNEPVSPHGFSDAAPNSSGNVLGEVINQHVQTLADTLEPPRNVASTLRNKRTVSDLRQAIGINDKFLLIRDLFGGDSDEYDDVMQRLNRFESLDDCVIYLTENYTWNANSDSVRMLMDLLERKFA